MAPRRLGLEIPTQSHLEWIATHARGEDVDELWASGHLTPQRALEKAVELSSEAWVATLDGTPICAFGVVPISTLGGWASPWMIGTPGVEGCIREFLPASRMALQHFRERWPRLTNFVDARNRKAIRWLAWLGFAIGPAIPHGEEGLPFHRFDLEVDHVQPDGSCAGWDGADGDHPDPAR